MSLYTSLYDRWDHMNQLLAVCCKSSVCWEQHIRLLLYLCESITILFWVKYLFMMPQCTVYSMAWVMHYTELSSTAALGRRSSMSQGRIVLRMERKDGLKTLEFIGIVVCQENKILVGKIWKYCEKKKQSSLGS